MDFAIVDQFAAWLSANPGWVAAALFSIALLESLAVIGLFVPGVVLLFSAATIAGSGALSFGQTLLFGYLGAVLGDWLSFWLGQHLQHRAHHHWPFNRYPTLMNRGDAFFQRYGVVSIALGRFLGPLRAFVPLIAGIMAMPTGRFMAANLVSALLWAFAYLTPGYWLGTALEATPLPPGFYTVLLALLLAVLIVAVVIKQLHRLTQPDGHLYRTLATRLKQRRGWLYAQGADGTLPLDAWLLGLSALGLAVALGLLDQASHTWHQAQLPWLLFLAHLREGISGTLFYSLSGIGDTRNLLLLATAVAVIVGRRHLYSALHIAALSLACYALTHGLKAWYALPRPDINAASTALHAYPSGHTSGAMAAAWTLGLFLYLCFPRWPHWQVFIWVLGIGSLISLSRLVLGVHWPIDVLGGLLLGTGLAACTYAHWQRQPPPNINLDRYDATILISTAALITLNILTRWPDYLARYQLA